SLYHYFGSIGLITRGREETDKKEDKNSKIFKVRRIVLSQAEMESVKRLLHNLPPVPKIPKIPATNPEN
ncbi:24278_t:CDS:1, partial [Racocetra persica]